MRAVTQVLIGFAAALLSMPARAEPLPAANRHLGWYVRLDAGAGYMNTSFDLAKFHGASGSLGGAFGAAIAENTMLSAYIYMASAPGPHVSGDPGAPGSRDLKLTMVGFGPEFTYYLMPANVYVSAAVSLTRLTAEYQILIAGNPEMGWGTRVALGKEWWAGTRTGFGLGAQFAYSSNSSSNADGSRFALSTWQAGVFVSLISG